MMEMKHVGIDVSKEFFDLHILEDNRDIHFEYTSKQVKKCVDYLTRLSVVLVVLESTGGYEIPLACELQAARLPVAIVNPRRIRDFAKAQGQMAKTDKLDARNIAYFGATLQPPPRKVINENQRILKALAARRDQLIKMRVAETNRMEHVLGKEVARSLRAILRALEKEIERVDQHIKDHIDQQPELKQKVAILKSVPGIGDISAHMLVVELPELGLINKKEIAALVGVAPMNRDSGMFKGKRMTGGGRRQVRTKMYMPTLVAIQHNPVIRQYYLKLLEKGKSKMTAVVAAMRKLIVILA
ncbi:MAG: IS110 family transposase [Deltaproteobacteria bacterium]|nr:IS110 family transposase [Deltaproteobacteria bacterium]